MRVNRRDLLATVAAGTGALAGCLTGGDGDGTTTDGTTKETGTTVTEATEATATTTSASGASVVMSDSSFAPRTVSVDVGTTVTWTNTDSYDHDVTSAQFNDGAASWEFASETVGEGGEVSYAFEEAGAYEYYCTIHGQSTMCGAVLVGGAEMAGDLPCSGGY